MRRAVREILGFLGEILRRCALHSIDTQSAALAFYSLFALAPLLLVIVSIAGRTLAEGQARGEIVRQLQGFMGSEAGHAVATLLEKAAKAGADRGAVGIVGIVVLALATTAVFLQLQEALNKVWEVAARPGQMFHALLKRRVASFALVLAAGALLLVSLTLSAALLAITDRLAERMPLPVGLITLGNEVLSFLVLTVLLAVIYRVLPDAKLEWQDVGIGAVVTSSLFSTGKWLIGVVLARSAATSQLGIAGSTVVILLWVYYESYILLFGAELTAVYSSRYRHQPVTPEAGATRAGVLPGRAVP